MIALRPFTVCLPLLALLLAVGCRRPATPPGHRTDAPAKTSIEADVAQLAGLMRERLLVMHDVARWKWRDRQPVKDSVREAALLEQVRQEARDLGLDTGLATRFMTAQVAAARMLQEQDLERWQSQPPSAETPLKDLKSELRPQIDRLNKELLRTLARLAPRLDDEEIQRRLERIGAEDWSGTNLDEPIRRTALVPLIAKPRE